MSGASLEARRLGRGPTVVLLHGGLGPELTWERQEPLAKRWRLVIPWRRGFEPSPAIDRQDFERDAGDLEQLLEAEGGAHVAGFSYGGIAAAIVAQRSSSLVRSLTLIEAPLYALAPGDPEVERLERLGDAFLAGGQDPDDLQRRSFLQVAGIPADATDDPRIESAMRLATGGRPPGEAQLDPEAIVAAGVPVLVASGDHAPALERLCDGVAERLGGDRIRVAGAGHAVPRARGFNELFERFLRDAEPETKRPEQQCASPRLR